jgi:cell shape-determining protein MreC
MTPKGIEEKANVTVRFLKQKVSEYESLKTEIEFLRQEAQESTKKSQDNEKRTAE